MPPRHLLLLYTATCGPPVSRPSLKPGIHLSRAEYLSLMHKYLSFPPPGIFVSPIYLYFSYICLGQISVTVQCFYLSHICFSESLSFQVTDKPRFCETLVPRNCSTRICNHSFIQGGLYPGICHIEIPNLKCHCLGQMSYNLILSQTNLHENKEEQVLVAN